MRVLTIGTFAIALLGASGFAPAAEHAAVEEKLGPSYTLTMEGMT